MISISKFRKLLGARAENMSDEDVRLFRDSIYLWARLMWPRWQRDVMKLDKKS